MALTFEAYQQSLRGAPGLADAVAVAAIMQVIVYEEAEEVYGDDVSADSSHTNAAERPTVAQRWAFANRITELLTMADPGVLADAIAANELTAKPDSRLSIDLSHPVWPIQPANFRKTIDTASEQT